MSLLFGYHIPRFAPEPRPDATIFARVAELVREAENAGFGLVTVMDHFVQIPSVGKLRDPMLEAYSTLGALSQVSRTAMLGTLVTGVTYRNPALLAKTVTTLDVLSGGRAILGIGAAWNEDEHQRYGFAYPTTPQRMDRLDEALRICKLMFQQVEPRFDGLHYRIDRALNYPRPVRNAGPPILVGGVGEQRTLRLAARYADLTHWFALDLDVLKRKTEVLERHCEAIGRDPTTIQRLTTSPVLLAETRGKAQQLRRRLTPPRRASVVPTTVEEAAERLRPYIDAGFSGFTFDNPVLDSSDAIGLAGELIKLLQPRDRAGIPPAP